MCLSMQETQIHSLVWEDAKCPCAITTEPVLWSLGAATAEATCHTTGPHALESGLHGTRSRHEERPPRLESRPHLLQLERSPHSSEDPVQPNTKINNFKKWLYTEPGLLERGWIGSTVHLETSQPQEMGKIFLVIQTWTWSSGEN